MHAKATKPKFVSVTLSHLHRETKKQPNNATQKTKREGRNCESRKTQQRATEACKNTRKQRPENNTEHKNNSFKGVYRFTEINPNKRTEKENINEPETNVGTKATDSG